MWKKRVLVMFNNKCVNKTINYLYLLLYFCAIFLIILILVNSHYTDTINDIFKKLL